MRVAFRPQELALILVGVGMAQAEPETLEALKLRLQIAQAAQATAEAKARQAELAARAPAAPAVVAPAAKKYLLPREFVEVSTAGLFPLDGEGTKGAPQVLTLLGDEALASYVASKSQHAAWTYRRVRSAQAYLEMVDGALRDSVNNAEAIRKAFDAVLAAVSKLSGTDDEQKKAIEQLNVLAAEARKADNPAKHLGGLRARIEHVRRYARADRGRA